MRFDPYRACGVAVDPSVAGERGERTTKIRNGGALAPPCIESEENVTSRQIFRNLGLESLRSFAFRPKTRSR